MLAAPALDDVGNPLVGLTKKVVSGLIILSALVMTIAIAAGSFRGILSRAAGMPYAQAQAWMMLVDVVILFILAAFAIPLSNGVIDAVTGYTTPDIHLPGTS
ncbi:MAG: hypothetical protein E3J64_07925 [Anaerolineales bacterium]|nr:MAG: hypothetical protein E3J64_07925 [Anaerolineales bacterium]